MWNSDEQAQRNIEVIEKRFNVKNTLKDVLTLDWTLVDSCQVLKEYNIIPASISLNLLRDWCCG